MENLSRCGGGLGGRVGGHLSNHHPKSLLLQCPHSVSPERFSLGKYCPSAPEFLLESRHSCYSDQTILLFTVVSNGLSPLSQSANRALIQTPSAQSPRSVLIIRKPDG